MYRDDNAEFDRLLDSSSDKVLFQLHGDDVGHCGDTLAHLASRIGRSQFASALISKFLRSHEVEDLSKLVNRKGETVLHTATFAGKYFVVERIMKSIREAKPECDLTVFIDARDLQIEKRTALHLAALDDGKFGDKTLMTRPVNNGCLSGCVNPNGPSGKSQAASFLIGNGAALELEDIHGLTPFHLAVIHGQINVAKMLRRKLPNCINKPTNDGWMLSPLHLAVKQAAEAAVRIAPSTTSSSTAAMIRGMKQPAPTYSPNDFRYQRAFDMIEWLIHEGADLNATDAAGRLPQHVFVIADEANEKRNLVLALSRFGLHY